jgi:hypothetical protein
MGRWVGRLYPTAGEGHAIFRTAREARPVGDGRVGGGASGDGLSAHGVSADEVAVRRARGRIRRYCAANLLNRLGTLTYEGEGCHDPRVLRHDLRIFFRELRGELGGGAFPYVWVPELHASGHGLHVHYAVARFILVGVIRRSWDHGFVHIKLLGDLSYAASRRDEARHAARYLSKYVSKSMDAGWPGLHRYDVGEGFPPPVEGFSGPSCDAVLGCLGERMGREPDYRKGSEEWAGYRGPAAVFVSWD